MPAGELNRTNFDKWKKQWNRPRQIAYENIACEVLNRHGYETIIDQVAPPCGLGMRLFWYCDNKVRKWTYRRYWQDNLYKIGRRGRDVLQAVRSLVVRPQF